jgi:cyclic-di-GMP phosphodiesterase, flagellum assembly factor TipF
MRNHNGIADLIVKGAIALVTAAFFIGAYLQFQVTFWLSLIAALSVYITLLMLHALMRRSERVDALVSEVSRLEGEVARLHGDEGAEPAPRAASRQRAGAAPSAPPSMQPGGRSAAPPVPPPMPRSAPAAASAPPLDRKAPTAGRAPAPSRENPPSLGPSLGAQMGSDKASFGDDPFAPPSLSGNGPAEHDVPPAGSPWPGLTDEPDATHDYWSFRPSKPALGESDKPKAKGKAKSKKEDAPAADREADLDAVHGMIKRLASEVNLGGADGTSQGEPASQDSLIDALQATADTMRSKSAKAPALGGKQGSTPGPMPPPIAPGHTRISSVAAAVAAGRMDSHLNPIVGLGDHHVHHYEITIVPRDELGLALPLPVDDRQLAGTGVLPLLDSARINRAARVCRSLAGDRQKQTVFGSVNAESLSSDRFLDELANIYRDREAVAGELVLTFTQAEVKSFGGPEWSALTDMRDLGFRFALDAVTDVDYEFTALKAAGFAFVKIEAPDFLEGLPSAAEVMPSGEICMHLGELGLTVVVGHIDDEETRVAVAEFGPPLGQGLLFGPTLKASEDGVPGSAAA